MRVLVSVASKHGATAEIAGALATAFADAGLDADLVSPDRVTDVEGFDAFVIGSAVYLGHWMDAAANLIELHEAALRARPVWLFSSGPVGDPSQAAEDPEDVARLVEISGARGHRLFAGEVDRNVLGLGEKVLLAAVHAPEGDYRPWPEILAWAGEIAAELTSPTGTTAGA